MPLTSYDRIKPHPSCTTMLQYHPSSWPFFFLLKALVFLPCKTLVYPVNLAGLGFRGLGVSGLGLRGLGFRVGFRV